MTTPAEVAVPDGGLWHVGRGADLCRFHRPDPVVATAPLAGNRYDSFHGNYGVVYFGATAEACFAEVLARLRPKPALAALVTDEWDQRNFMLPGNIAADWRLQRVLVRATVLDPLPFVDAAHPDTLEAFRRSPQIAAWLRSFGIEPTVDLGSLLGSDRRITRLISQWVYDAVDDDERAVYGGIRYMSRQGEGYECWAVFEGNEVELQERHPIDPHRPDLQLVAKRYLLTIH